MAEGMANKQGTNYFPSTLSNGNEEAHNKGTRDGVKAEIKHLLSISRA